MTSSIIEEKREVTTEPPTLYAFWSYDQYPYFLGGEILRFMDNGNVQVKEYTGFTFQPFAMYPKKKALEILDLRRRLVATKRKVDASVKAVSHAFLLDSISNLGVRKSFEGRVPFSELYVDFSDFPSKMWYRLYDSTEGETDD